MVGLGRIGRYKINGKSATFIKGCFKMKQYRVVDDRNRYRNDPDCEIKHDNEERFIVHKKETDINGDITHRVIILNAKKFQKERIVDEQEAILLIMKGIRVEEIKNVP
jgi:hypothetical protein